MRFLDSFVDYKDSCNSLDFHHVSLLLSFWFCSLLHLFFAFFTYLKYSCRNEYLTVFLGKLNFLYLFTISTVSESWNFEKIFVEFQKMFF